ncbi:hypothetical protein MalM25_10520 [Planctomycetes bacterium MalM25]|nr:hypothetical protein MalM25_10520 [Planctomycetes bacterium MalM25]
MATHTPVAPSGSTIDTTKVTGRRELRFDTYEDLLADAEQMASIKVRTLGNWSYPQILDHLAKSLNKMIDGPGFMLPMPVRFIMRHTVMKKMVNEALDPGFKFPASVAKDFTPDATTELGPALDSLRAAIERVNSDPTRAKHPGFGTVTTAEWDGFQLRHCEMHMSFVLPA